MADHLDAGMGPHHRSDVRLTPLSKLDWKISEGEPDIRGWEVRTVGGRTIGKVKDLLVDPEAREVVMLDIDLDGTDRHALAPIRAADVDPVTRIVRIDSSDIDGELPWLARRGTTDQDAAKFTDDYSRAYGDRGFDRERNFVVDRDDDEVHFRRRDMAAAESEALREDARREEDRREAAQDAAQVPRDPRVIEEVVVRRRVVSPDELDSSR